MATAKTRTGFKAPCLRCGENDTVMLDLSDLETCHCNSCDAEFTIEQVREVLVTWAKIIAWIDTAPAPVD